ncbi:MAG: hypothetical protein HC854_09170 [Flavobacterium sp.]|nr:hypothetical protein [Flavobacterium sp.]
MIDYKHIAIKEKFNEQYTIDIETELNGVDMYITSKIRLRYDFSVTKINENHSFEIRLIQLDNTLLEANNPMVKEVAQVSQVFGKMYSELNLKLDVKGKVLEVLNYDVILAKWNDTKAEMEKALQGNENLKNAISLNDQIYTNPKKVKEALEANEFFKVYFGQIFGINFPLKGKAIEGTNFFNTANMQWAIDIESTAFIPSEYKHVDITMIGKPANALTTGFHNAAYNQFAKKIDISTLKPQLDQYEIRKVEIKTGKVVEALLTKTEIADPEKLFTKFRYTLRSDSFTAEIKKFKEQKMKS